MTDPLKEFKVFLRPFTLGKLRELKTLILSAYMHVQTGEETDSFNDLLEQLRMTDEDDGYDEVRETKTSLIFFADSFERFAQVAT